MTWRVEKKNSFINLDDHLNYAFHFRFQSITIVCLYQQNFKLQLAYKQNKTKKFTQSNKGWSWTLVEKSHHHHQQVTRLNQISSSSSRSSHEGQSLGFYVFFFFYFIRLCFMSFHKLQLGSTHTHTHIQYKHRKSINQKNGLKNFRIVCEAFLKLFFIKIIHFLHRYNTQALTVRIVM